MFILHSLFVRWMFECTLCSCRPRPNCLLFVRFCSLGKKKVVCACMGVHVNTLVHHCVLNKLNLYYFTKTTSLANTLRLQQSWNCRTSHWVLPFLCKQAWPHLQQTRGEQTLTSLCLVGQQLSAPHVWQQRGTNTKKKKKAAFQISDVHIWSAASLVNSQRTELCWLWPSVCISVISGTYVSD